MYVYLGVTSEARELERDHCWGLGGGDSRTPVTGRHRGGAPTQEMTRGYRHGGSGRREAERVSQKLRMCGKLT